MEACDPEDERRSPKVEDDSLLRLNSSQIERGFCWSGPTSGLSERGPYRVEVLKFLPGLKTSCHT